MTSVEGTRNQTNETSAECKVKRQLQNRQTTMKSENTNLDYKLPKLNHYTGFKEWEKSLLSCLGAKNISHHIEYDVKYRILFEDTPHTEDEIFQADIETFESSVINVKIEQHFV